MAHSGRVTRADECLLSGVKQTLTNRCSSIAIYARDFKSTTLAILFRLSPDQTSLLPASGFPDRPDASST
jgi:hypothetical protein